MVGRSQTLMLTLRRSAEREPFRTNLQIAPCFGTEGSKVQILSPRPLFRSRSAELCLLEHSGSPECSTSQIPPSQQPLPESIEKSPAWRPRSLESTWSQRESLCVTLCQTEGARDESWPRKNSRCSVVASHAGRKAPACIRGIAKQIGVSQDLSRPELL